MDIQKLNRTLSELSKLDINDLKNIDYKKLVQDLFKKKDKLTRVIAVFLSIIAGFYIWTNNGKTLNRSKEQLSILQEQLAAFKELSIAKADFQKTLDALPEPLEYKEMIEKINESAIANNIDVLNFSPANIQAGSLYDLIRVHIAVLAPSYTHFWQFIHTLDSSPHALRVESIQGRPAASKKEITENKLNIDLEVSSLKIKK